LFKGGFGTISSDLLIVFFDQLYQQLFAECPCFLQM